MPIPASAELVNPSIRRGTFRAAVFDFDGTVSLIREGWAAIMADQGAGLLVDQGLVPFATRELLTELENQMLRLSGKPSIYQMRKLAEIVETHGGTRPDADDLLKEFLRRLSSNTGHRYDALRHGKAKPNAWAVAGSHALLDELRRRGVALFLASGTDLAFVRTEADLLKLTDYFAPHIYAPANNTPQFTKRDVFEMLVRDHGFAGEEILGFGDGYAETVEVKRIGGLAVGVASQEPGRPGVNALKRTMLMGLGADVIVPDYRDHAAPVSWLFADDTE